MILFILGAIAGAFGALAVLAVWLLVALARVEVPA